MVSHLFINPHSRNSSESPATQVSPTKMLIRNVHSVIALSGLSSHAFGSWKSPSASHIMWLRDVLRADFPNFRILTWGYDSDLKDPTSTSSIMDFSRGLLNAVHSARDGNVRVSISTHLTPLNTGDLIQENRRIVFQSSSSGIALGVWSSNRYEQDMTCEFNVPISTAVLLLSIQFVY
jgi:hypothetical protein